MADDSGSLYDWFWTSKEAVVGIVEGNLRENSHSCLPESLLSFVPALRV